MLAMLNTKKENGSTMVVCGLVAGRHEMPVSQYIWDAAIPSEDAMKRNCLYNHITEVMPGDVEIIDVYVTGFTPGLLALVAWCFDHSVTLVTHQYDAMNHEYYIRNVEMVFTECPFCKHRHRLGAWYCPQCGAN
jgi:hypothetical protein